LVKRGGLTDPKADCFSLATSAFAFYMQLMNFLKTSIIRAFQNNSSMFQ